MTTTIQSLQADPLTAGCEWGTSLVRAGDGLTPCYEILGRPPVPRYLLIDWGRRSLTCGVEAGIDVPDRQGPVQKWEQPRRCWLPPIDRLAVLKEHARTERNRLLEHEFQRV